MNRDSVMQWEMIHGVVTPGGDPAYICPVCHSRQSEHINGIECRQVYNYCPNCGQRLVYYWREDNEQPEQ